MWCVRGLVRLHLSYCTIWTMFWLKELNLYFNQFCRGVCQEELTQTLIVRLSLMSCEGVTISGLKVKGVAKKPPSNPRLLATAPKQTTPSSEQHGHREMCYQGPKWPEGLFEVKCSAPTVLCSKFIMMVN